MLITAVDLDMWQQVRHTVPIQTDYTVTAATGGLALSFILCLCILTAYTDQSYKVGAIILITQMRKLA